jgi:dimethylargininase
VLALTRDVSDAIVRCALTHQAREPIDVSRARTQHRAYEAALASHGCEVRRVECAPELPDSVFIEDTAVVLPELAIVARPGAESRRAEVPVVADVLSGLRRLAFIEEPGTLDGGDVLVIGRRALVGRSSRTNAGGIDQVRAVLEPLGYIVDAVETTRCLHLKSAVTALDDGTVLTNPAWVPSQPFDFLRRIDVHPSEAGAANVVSVGGRLLVAAAYPRTRERLAAAGYDSIAVDASELAKAEAALTCCSLLVST